MRRTRKKGILKSKRGNAILDLIVIIIVLFVFIFVAMAGGKLFGDLKDDIIADDSLSNTTKDIVQTQYDRSGSLMDGIFMFALILLWAAGIVASFVIEDHPIFAVFTFILLIALLIVAIFLGNAYEETATSDEYSSVVATFPMANWVMTHFLLVILVIGGSIALTLYAKNRVG